MRQVYGKQIRVFIAGRSRNKDNILKICGLLDKYKFSYYCFLKNEDNWGYGSENQTPEEKQKEFESLGLKSEIVLNLFNQDMDGERNSKKNVMLLVNMKRQILCIISLRKYFQMRTNQRNF